MPRPSPPLGSAGDRPRWPRRPSGRRGTRELIMAAVADMKASSAMAKPGRRPRRRWHHRDHRQAVLAGEVQVALVVAGAAEDRRRCRSPSARSWRPDRQLLARVERMRTRSPVSKPRFSAFSIASSLVPRRWHSATKAATRGPWRPAPRPADGAATGAEGGAEQGVRAGGEDRQPSRLLVTALGTKLEEDPAPFRSGRSSCAASGCTLSGQRSSSSRASSSSSAKSVILKNHWASLRCSTGRAGAPAAAVDHLLVGQHRVVDRVPVDPGLLAVDQALRPGSRGTAFCWCR